ncbi:MAG: TetR family transcriptional regulator C-terminal domain-containing protein [Proteobacteria bacterium]|nr:TetR family transcriptional regulator C-terminal domain-containing protein [Pseudomonadota bacterium]
MKKTAERTVRPQGRGDAKRQRLVDIGTAIFTQKGFSSTGLDEIVQLAEVPKGSFYYYFPSKEDYAHAVIRNYAGYFAKKLDRTLGDERLTPLARLRAFADDATRGVLRYEFKRGCLVGNLGQEMASLEAEFRIVLLEVLDDWRRRFARCIDEAKAAGEIATSADSAALASFFWSAWEGAVLCAKLEESTRALDCVSTLFFEQMLRPAAPSSEPAAAPRGVRPSP